MCYCKPFSISSVRSGLVLLGILLSTLISTMSANAATFAVNSTNDIDDGSCDLTHCSLREAINASNAAAGPDTISFSALPSVAPWSIQPTSALPRVFDTTGGTTIDGWTSPGWVDRPLLELDGSSAPAGTIGLFLRSANNIVRGLVINRFSSQAIMVQAISTNDPSPDNNVIVGNYLGTDIDGTTALGNSTGVYVYFSPGRPVPNGTRIGGSAAVERNVISGNRSSGITTSGDGTIVIGNYIGTDYTGTAALGNGSVFAGAAVWIGGSNTQVGGTAPGTGNILSGNDRGVNVQGRISNNVIEGNLIGTDVTGTVAIPNDIGVQLDSGADTIIGGLNPAAGNVISGNTYDGIYVARNPTGTIILNNIIGTDPTSTLPLGNRDGIIATSTNVVIGTIDAGNVIAANRNNGISLPRGADGAIIQGNYIGTDRSTERDLGNARRGIILGADNIQVGGEAIGEGNVIAHNEQEGIFVGGQNSAILRNSIFDNGRLGIGLGNGSTPNPNDPGDGDGGANGYQNYPTITSAVAAANSIAIGGSLDSIANATFRVELFANAACDASEFGEGEIFLDTIDVTTNGAGITDFSLTVAGNLTTAQIITATATDALGNSSEFSQCFVVSAAVNQVPVPTLGPVGIGILVVLFVGFALLVVARQPERKKTA